MKVERLHIDGFGVFHDKEIKGFKSGVNILYGPNEAGKSTLLDFIRYTLFEYPRFLEQRRPPLQGGKHGGRIWLRNEADEPLSIYRHGNAKDVKFEYQNQTVENTNTYQRLIGNATIDLYRNVYAITLDELMEVEQLSDSGMEDRIFSMGMGLSGVNFGKFEADLKKNAEDLFTVRGRTQVLPELTNKIQDKEQEIRKLRNKLGEYNRLSEQKERLEEELSELKEKRENYGLLANRYEDLKRAYPSFVEYREAKKELDQARNVETFGFHLLEDFQEVKRKLNAEEKELSRIENKITQLAEKIKGLKWDKELAEHTSLLDYFKTSIKIYEQSKTELVQEEEKRERAIRAIEDYSKMLGDNSDVEKLIQLKGSLELQSKAAKSLETLQSFMRQLEGKNETLNSQRNEFDQLNSRRSELENRIGALEIKNEEEKKKQNEEKISLETQFQQALKGAGNQNLPGRNMKLMYLLLGLFLVLGGVLFVVNTTAAIAVLVAVLVSFIILMISAKTNTPVTPTNEVDPNSINLKIEKIKNEINNFEVIATKLDELNSSIQEKQRIIEVITEEIGIIAEKVEKVKSDWANLLKENSLPESLEIHQMSAFLSTVEEIKRQDNAKKEAQSAIEKNTKRIEDFEGKVKEVVPDITSVDAAFIYSLIDKIEQNQKIQEEKQRREEELSILKEEETQSKTELNNLKNSLEKLLSEVKVKNENEFQAHFEKQKEQEEARARMESAEMTIRTICGEDKLEKTLEELSQMTPAELKVKQEETHELYKQYKQEYDEMNREMASVSTEIRHILEPDEMYNLQNEKESLEAQLKEGTKEWLANKMALRIISESKQKYEEEKQPEVITQTRDYLREITDNAYEDLRISLSEKHVSLIDKQGKQKTVEELSRGTREQLLLALRMGLISEYEKGAEPLPVALDDVMVNFDVHRAENLAKTLTHFAENRQVIMFTCHEHTKELFKEYGANIVEW